jgi:hypothetical protein
VNRPIRSWHGSDGARSYGHAEIRGSCSVGVSSYTVMLVVVLSTMSHSKNPTSNTYVCCAPWVGMRAICDAMREFNAGTPMRRWWSG